MPSNIGCHNRIVPERGQTTVTETQIQHWTVLMVGQLAREAERAHCQFLGWPTVDVSDYGKHVHIDVRVAIVPQEHVNLSTPGVGACLCGARPGAGEHIPSWWVTHAARTGSLPRED